MQLGEKLRAILERLEGKALAPDALHLRELAPSVPCNPADIDEYEAWEYKIGEDILKITWDLEDMDDCISVSLNGETVYSGWNQCNDKTEAYDDDAEDLFLLVMQHGGTLLPQSDLNFAAEYLAFCAPEVLEMRRNRAERQVP